MFFLFRFNGATAFPFDSQCCPIGRLFSIIYMVVIYYQIYTYYKQMKTNKVLNRGRWIDIFMHIYVGCLVVYRMCIIQIYVLRL